MANIHSHGMRICRLRGCEVAVQIGLEPCQSARATADNPFNKRGISSVLTGLIWPTNQSAFGYCIDKNRTVDSKYLPASIPLSTLHWISRLEDRLAFLTAAPTCRHRRHRIYDAGDATVSLKLLDGLERYPEILEKRSRAAWRGMGALASRWPGWQLRRRRTGDRNRQPESAPPVGHATISHDNHPVVYRAPRAQGRCVPWLPGSSLGSRLEQILQAEFATLTTYYATRTFIAVIDAAACPECGKKFKAPNPYLKGTSYGPVMLAVINALFARSGILSCSGCTNAGMAPEVDQLDLADVHTVRT